MKLVSVSYNAKKDEADPTLWLDKIGFYTGILESLSVHCEVVSVDMIAWEGTIEKKGVQHCFLPHTTSFSRLNRFVKKQRPDIVLVQGTGYIKEVIHLGLVISAKTKVIVQHHAERPPQGLKRFLFTFMDRYVKAYFFASTSLAEQWLNHEQIAKKAIAIPEASSIHAKSENIENSCGDFIWVGRLNANKDPLTVAKAFAEYVQKNNAARLWMIFQTGELLEPLQAASANVPNITLVGNVEKHAMAEWYSKAAFIICSSYYEGCNISVIEGMSCGCIPIVTNIPSFDLHTDHGRLGLRFEPGNMNQLRECLEDSAKLNIDEEKGKVLRYFRENLSFESIAGKIYSAINTL